MSLCQQDQKCAGVLELRPCMEGPSCVNAPLRMWCDTEGPPLRTTGCASGGGVLLSVRGMACFECGKMLCRSTVIMRMSAAFSTDAFRLKTEKKNSAKHR